MLKKSYSINFQDIEHADEMEIVTGKRKQNNADININEHKEKHDEFGFSTSWKRAFGEIYNKASWLHGFCQINKIAINKILIKFNDKFIENLIIVEGAQAQEHIRVVKEIFDDLNCFSEKFDFITEIDGLANTRITIIEHFADHFCNGKIDKAKSKLEERLSGGTPKSMKLNSFYIGVLFSSIVFSILIFLIPCKFIGVSNFYADFCLI